MSNIDFELQDGNPAAIAVRFHVAQHSELTHMNFRIGTARAAVEDIGNQASDIHVTGGEYGIITKRTAPVWQFLLMDSSFEGQRAAAIKTQEAGFTLIRVNFSNMPGGAADCARRSGAALRPGSADGEHSRRRFRGGQCPQPALRGDPGQHRMHGRAAFFWSDDQGARQTLRRGALFPGLDDRRGRPGGRHRDAPPGARAQQTRTGSARGYSADSRHGQLGQCPFAGRHGDGKTDDTDALLAAIEKHATLFFPSGTYRVSRPLTLKPDTALIGLNPATTRFRCSMVHLPSAARDSPVGIIVAPKDGRTSSARSPSPRAARIARGCSDLDGGKNSLLDDVSFPGQRFFGSGFRGFAFPRRPLTTGPVVRPNFDISLVAADLLVTDGGGGIFRNNWPHGSNARIGLRVENTATPGKIYQMSVEHHMRVESEFHKVRNWEMYAFQTEEENPAGATRTRWTSKTARACCSPTLTCIACRATCCPRPTRSSRGAPTISLSKNVKVFSQTRLAFDNAIYNEANGAFVRSHFFTRFTVNAGSKPRAPSSPPASLFASETLQQLAVASAMPRA
jgi:hypothetical protein